MVEPVPETAHFITDPPVNPFLALAAASEVAAEAHDAYVLAEDRWVVAQTELADAMGEVDAILHPPANAIDSMPADMFDRIRAGIREDFEALSKPGADYADSIPRPDLPAEVVARHASIVDRIRAAVLEEAAGPTHGRHCPCSACAREDWTDPNLAPCGMHGPSCPAVYAPEGVTEPEADEGAPTGHAAQPDQAADWAVPIGGGSEPWRVGQAKLPRDVAMRDPLVWKAILAAAPPIQLNAGKALGVSRARVDQLIRDMRQRGTLPAEVAAHLQARGKAPA